MDDILKMLYNGKIYPAEKRFEHSAEYAAAVADLENCEQKLRDVLAQEYWPILDEFLKAQVTLDDQTGFDYFNEGFRLGAQIMLAAIGDKDTPPPVFPQE